VSLEHHVVFEAGIALALMATAALISARLRFSIVPFLILAGMVVGPHAPHLTYGFKNFSASANSCVLPMRPTRSPSRN
jgi:Kef-type K+ transport system membrane component KefB